jgi:hypothetical protein
MVHWPLLVAGKQMLVLSWHGMHNVRAGGRLLRAAYANALYQVEQPPQWRHCTLSPMHRCFHSPNTQPLVRYGSCDGDQTTYVSLHHTFLLTTLSA